MHLEEMMAAILRDRRHDFLACPRTEFPIHDSNSDPFIKVARNPTLFKRVTSLESYRWRGRKEINWRETESKTMADCQNVEE